MNCITFLSVLVLSCLVNVASAQPSSTSVFHFNRSGNKQWLTHQDNYCALYRIISNEAFKQLDERADLSVENIITEYCDAFGESSAEIRQYLDYWEQYHKKVAYNSIYPCMIQMENGEMTEHEFQSPKNEAFWKLKKLLLEQ
ncbi:MAG: hypothetical protein Q7J86_15200 [Bacteroidota bacterium]|nr:hypothetical protein [Bacteroidota bacterium]